MQAGTREGAITELLVTWQQPETRAMLPVARLSFDGEAYRFNYLPTAKSIDGFRPLIGFKDVEKTYESGELFPLFQERVLDPARDDFERVLTELDLDPAKATPWEQLVRSGGGSEGDTLQVTPLPHQDHEVWECTALVAGLRYFQMKSVLTELGETPVYSADGFEAVLNSLEIGTSLVVRKEIGNVYNPDALLLFTSDGDVLGYLPDWVARLSTASRVAGGADPTVRVERVNALDSGWHLRVLVSVKWDSTVAQQVDRLRSGELFSH